MKKSHSGEAKFYTDLILLCVLDIVLQELYGYECEEQEPKLHSICHCKDPRYSKFRFDIEASDQHDFTITVSTESKDVEEAELQKMLDDAVAYFRDVETW